MGSSPVTATNPSPILLSSLLDRLAAELAGFFRGQAPVEAGSNLLVAFSGGPDSTALLLGIHEIAPELGIHPVAVHVDHGLDPGSEARAGRAEELASEIGVECLVVTVAVPKGRISREGLEAAARATRYEGLERRRLEIDSPWVVTAHHRDDQVETVLLRIGMGTGPRGLAGMSPVRESLARPLLSWPRARLAALVRERGLSPAADPGNRDLRRPRNLLRLGVLPRRPHWAEPVLRTASAARACRERIDRRLKPLIRDTERGPTVRREDLAGLPEALQDWLLALLHEAWRRPHPPPAGAANELRRQLASGHRIGADCGGGWRWIQRREGISLRPPRAAATSFAYTLRVPGVLDVEEIGYRIRVERRPIAGWMREGRPDRAALRFPFETEGTVEIRTRRPGDRLRPLGAGYERRLKDVLIDQKVPRDERSAIPLLCVDERIAWVPGVTIHDDFRLRPGDGHAWVASLERNT